MDLLTEIYKWLYSQPMPDSSKERPSDKLSSDFLLLGGEQDETSEFFAIHEGAKTAVLRAMDNLRNAVWVEFDIHLELYKAMLADRTIIRNKKKQDEVMQLPMHYANNRAAALRPLQHAERYPHMSSSALATLDESRLLPDMMQIHIETHRKGVLQEIIDLLIAAKGKKTLPQAMAATLQRRQKTLETGIRMSVTVGNVERKKQKNAGKRGWRRRGIVDSGSGGNH